jgi:small-conductance mechanosensitive channel
MTRNHGYEMAKITVGVAYGSKIDHVREMIIDRIKQLDCYDPSKGVQVLFQNFGESSVDLLVVVWVRVASQVADIAKIKENIYDVLNENGIEIPFPQTDIHIQTLPTDKTV